MTRWLSRAILAIVVLAIGFWLWTVLFPSPQRAIRKRLGALAKSASFARNESPVAVGYNAQKLAGFFTSDVEIKVDLPGRPGAILSGRDELVQAAIASRAVSGSLKVEFFDVEVIVASDKQSAEAKLTLRARISGDTLVQELKLLLNKMEGDWRIKRLETVKTLSRNTPCPPFMSLRERKEIENDYHQEKKCHAISNADIVRS